MYMSCSLTKKKRTQDDNNLLWTTYMIIYLCISIYEIQICLITRNEASILCFVNSRIR